MSTRLEILEKINRGEISAEEGAQELEKLTELERQPKNENDVISEKMKVLQMIETGEISATEGAARLRGTDEPEEETEITISTVAGDDIPRPEPEEFRKWREWWVLPFGVGIGIVALSGMWMDSSWENAGGVNFWYFCAWLPMLLGLLIAAIGWTSRNGPWVHVRVDSEDTRVRVSLPIPLGISGWGLRTFGHYIPNMDASSLDEILIALEQTTSGEAPLYIKVNEGGDNGEEVEVFIG